MLFGNWNVTEGGIAWNSAGLNHFTIPLQDLNTLHHSKTGNGVYYDWILRATDEDWITQDDLYDLNYAFVYAVAHFGLDFDYEIFDATLEEQYDRLDAEEDEDPDW